MHFFVSKKFYTTLYTKHEGKEVLYPRALWCSVQALTLFGQCFFSAILPIFLSWLLGILMSSPILVVKESLFYFILFLDFTW